MSTQLIEVKHMKEFLDYVPVRGVALQAGGNVGVYPLHLAQHFERVLTFEPDANNFACLTQNIAPHSGKIAAYHAALGSHDGTVATAAHQPDDNGCIRVIEVDGGKVPMRIIDDLGLGACDLIWLDVEGMEEAALRGAEQTIARCRPAVIVEENMNPLMHGLDVGGAGRWLEERGYNGRMKIGNDRLYLPVC